jgi:catalase
VSPALSLDNQPRTSIATRKIAMLVADGFDGAAAEEVRAALVAHGAIVEVIAPVLGTIASQSGAPVEADKTFKTGASVFYDALFVPGGQRSVASLERNGDAVHFLQEAYKHGKAIAAIGEAVDLCTLAELEDDEDDAAADAHDVAADTGIFSEHGVVTARTPRVAGELAEAFVLAIAMHRHWGRNVDAISA